MYKSLNLVGMCLGKTGHRGRCGRTDFKLKAGSIALGMGGVTPKSQTGEGTAGGSCLVAWKIRVQLVTRGEPSVALMAKNLTHHANELEGADIAHPIIDPVGVFAGGKNTFVPQDG